jgi:hypothetical protein
VTVNHGDDAVFLITPEEGHHISVIVSDGVPDDRFESSYAINYLFESVTKDITFDVYFAADGTAIVLPGTDIPTFLSPFASPGVRLIFTSTEGGTVSGSEIDNELFVVLWEIDLSDVIFTEVEIALQYDDTGLSLDDELALRMYLYESLEELRSDVNGDGTVNGQDTSTVANHVKQADWYEPLYDLDDDGDNDEVDIQIVNTYKGTSAEDITIYDNGVPRIDTEANIVYGMTDHNRFPGIRR